MKRILFLTLALVLLLTLAVTPVMAKPSGQPDMLNDTVVLAADHHLDLQGTYGTYDNWWEWIVGNNSGSRNQGGIGATGLLAAWEKTSNPDYLYGAILASDTLVALYNAAPENRTYSQDIEFLVRLSQDSGDEDYSTVAQEWYDNTMSAFSVEALADYYIDGRKSLSGWDLASHIRAALAVGQVDYAAGIAARLIERRADWEGVLLGGWDYTMSSYASLLWAFAELSDNSFNGYVGDIRDALVEAQASDGSWDDGDHQSTAYAILGLDADGTARGAQAKAWAFLRDTQDDTGGWTASWGDEYSEVNAEVIMALSALDLKGLKAGYTDPNPDRGNDTGKHKLDPVTP